MKKTSSPGALPNSVAVGHLMDVLRVEGLSGQEGALVRLLREKLAAMGCPASWIRTDHANRPPPEKDRPFETGNLIVRIPGTIRAPTRMFLAHMDTVPMCRNAVPAIKGRRIRARGKTAVRADNRTGVAALLAISESVLRDPRPHPPLTLLFTIAEEIGLYGAAAAKPADLGRPALAFNFDSGDPNELIVGAIGSLKWEAEILGISAHAGMHPENGVSAMLIFARALSDLAERGYFGRIIKGRRTGTANVGIVQGGEATNQVTDRLIVRGECRSHDRAFLDVIMNAYRTAFDRAARRVRNRAGAHGSARMLARRAYQAFRLPETMPEVRFALRVAAESELTPRCAISNGGLDANPLVAAGIPTITLGAGQHGAHSVDEYVDVDEFLAGCRLGIALASAPFPKPGRTPARRS